MSSSICEKENELFEKWKVTRKNFIPDGLVDEQSYLSSQPKIVFILKEPNSEESDWKLRDFLRSGNSSKTWDNVARWMIGIRQINVDLDWKLVEKLDKEKRINALSTIGAINLKKSIGGNTTVNEELKKVVYKDAHFIKQQFSFYDSDLVICCGAITTTLFNKISGLPVDSKNGALPSVASGIAIIKIINLSSNIHTQLPVWKIVCSITVWLMLYVKYKNQKENDDF